MADLTGQSLGRYHILEQLGEGGMATVYKAYDTRLERNVAIKIIRYDVTNNENKERFLKRFEREAKSLAQLSHPNIVKILDYGDQKDTPNLVMEFIPGGTLKQFLGGKTTTWQDAIQWIIPIARALSKSHSAGIIHRDVKPSNILINANQEPMLTDFGIAKLLKDEETIDLTGTGKGLGTPAYMAPEQGLGKELDSRADVYSLGVVFFELITGSKPYHDSTPMALLHRQLTQPIPSIRKLVPNLPKELELVITRALAKDPEDRYRDMDDFMKDLEHLASGKFFHIRKGYTPRVTKKMRIFKISGLAATLLLLLVFFGLLITTKNQNSLPVTSNSSEVLLTPINHTLSIASVFTPTLTLTPHQPPSLTPTQQVQISYLETITLNTLNRISSLGTFTYKGDFYKLSPSGRIMLTSTGNVYNIEQRMEICALEIGGNDQWRDAAVSDKLIFTTNYKEAKIIVWNASDCKLEKEIDFPSLQSASTIVLSPDETKILFSGYNYSPSNTLISLDWKNETISKQQEFGSSMNELVFAQDGASFVENSGGGYVTIRQFPDYSKVKSFTASSLWGHIWLYAPENNRLITSNLYTGIDTQIRVWEISSGKIIFQINDARAISEGKIAFSTDGKIMTTSTNTELNFTNIESNKIVNNLGVGKLIIGSVFSTNMKILLVLIDGNRGAVFGVLPN